MRTKRLLLAAALSFLGPLAGACARAGRTAPATSEPAPPVAGYRLVWRDEFGGASLDTAWWTAYPGARRDAQNDPEAASVARGVLTLATWTADGVHHTGFVDTAGKFAATYGYFEARVRFATSPGEWGAFWLQSPTMSTPPDDVGVAGAEVDVLEHRATDADGRDIANRYSINVHWDGYGPAHQHAGGEGTPAHSTAPLQGGWHTYAVLWTRERYVFYLDGVEQWATDQGVSHRSEFIKVTCEVQDGSWAGHIPAGGYGLRGSSATSMQVDWVRVWQPAP
jgi:beta-glucanase (GH16 family)